MTTPDLVAQAVALFTVKESAAADENMRNGSGRRGDRSARPN